VTAARSVNQMVLFLISVPLMIVAVAIAVVPLLVASHAHHRRDEAELAQQSSSETLEGTTVDAIDTHKEPEPLAA
jgi:membrane protein implicated in regulation of membrane protease activity